MFKTVLVLLRTTLFTGLLTYSVSCRALPEGETPPAPQTSAQDLSLSTYLAELDRCSAAVKNKEQISSLRQSLPPAWSVRVGESRVEVSTGWLRESLQQMEDKPKNAKTTRAEIQTRLNSLKTAAGDLAAVSEGKDSSDARAHLKEIFERQEFRQAKGPTAFQLWIRHAVRWLGEKIVRALMRLHVSRKNGNIFAWGVITIAFVLLGVWIYRRLAKATIAARLETAGKPIPSDRRQWIADALAAAERGDFREAIHCGYWAAVASLEDHRLLDRDRARTPRESLRLLGSHPSQQAMLGDLTRHFELIWYGYRPASREDWSDAHTLLEKMGCLKPSTVATANS